MADQIPYVPEYITFDLEQIPADITKSSDLASYVRLQIQGESVEMIESEKIALSMFIFNVMHHVCPEVVLSLKNGKKYIIYDHQPDRIIHPLDISESLSVKDDFDIEIETPGDCSIDLEEIWNSSTANNDEAKILECLDKVKKEIRRTKITNIIGKVPLLLILSAQHLIGNNTKQLFYKKDLSSAPKRVK